MTDGSEMFHRAAGRSFKGFSAEEEGEWKGPFYFVQAADPQLGLMKAWAIGDTDNGGDEWEQEVLLTEKAIQAVNRLTPLPRFMVICGDLIHAMPGTQWREAQERDLKNALQKVNPAIPLVFVSGNHDLGNTPSAQTVTDYCHSWGDDYFSFWVGGVLFLVLNSQLFFDSSACPELHQAHDAWLSQQLDEASQRKCRHVVVFQHIPLFVNSFEEEHDYFNLKRPVRQELLGKFRKAGVKDYDYITPVLESLHSASSINHEVQSGIAARSPTACEMTVDETEIRKDSEERA
ncbi:serine/threonine-protein phosphatase CPPED1 [Polypterus senegalus]|uniref:serine/threonine-protein phosphatase CPPED1 n=1 Tax=Polypterus senegalus TaxID=55291 RepID=UPI001966508F|nr:serine/threonine-protein phosphatase CPPED1 [Polypterus senegalus]